MFFSQSKVADINDGLYYRYNVYQNENYMLICAPKMLDLSTLKQHYQYFNARH